MKTSPMTIAILAIDNGNETTGLAQRDIGDSGQLDHSRVWRQQYAHEYEAGFGVPPLGCDNPNIVVSTAVDPNGVNLTCQANVNWGA